MVSMVRAQIADPEFANKAREGRLEDIRTCIACNQGCADRLFDRLYITCLQNATVGKEKEIGTIERTAKRKRVLIVGGGPGGMEAARVAALRGHDVTLMERDSQLGGRINLLIKVPSREEFGGVTRYLTKQIEKLGVKVKLGVEVTEEIVKKENPDVVIIATGAKPFTPTLPGIGQDNVTMIEKVLTGEAKVGEQVAIIDTTGLQEGPSTAEFLADQGKKVKLITPFIQVGPYLGFTNMINVYERLLSRGVVFISCSALKSIDGKRLSLRNVFSQQDSVIEDVDTVVLATGYRANDALYRILLKSKRKCMRLATVWHRVGHWTQSMRHITLLGYCEVLWS